MNISLRKANAVQSSIVDAIKGISIETSLELNEFQDVVAELQKANDILFANDSRRQIVMISKINRCKIIFIILITIAFVIIIVRH